MALVAERFWKDFSWTTQGIFATEMSDGNRTIQPEARPLNVPSLCLIYILGLSQNGSTVTHFSVLGWLERSRMRHTGEWASWPSIILLPLNHRFLISTGIILEILYLWIVMHCGIDGFRMVPSPESKSDDEFFQMRTRSVPQCEVVPIILNVSPPQRYSTRCNSTEVGVDCSLKMSLVQNLRQWIHSCPSYTRIINHAPEICVTCLF